LVNFKSSNFISMFKIATELYTTDATNIGGRKGHVKSSDGIIDMDVRMPAPGSRYTNPEQLFAAGYASCFNGAILAVAAGRDVNGAVVTAKVTLGKSEAGGFGLAVTLEVHLPHLSPEEAMQVVEDAHKVCPYSVATKGNIEVNLKAV
jgi:lipoyl-dependent peroxiredoxin